MARSCLQSRFGLLCRLCQNLTQNRLRSSPKAAELHADCSSAFWHIPITGSSFHALQYITEVPSVPPPSGSSGEPGSGKLSDHEYNVRLGRAIYTLETTLPKFFRIGLISYVEPDTSSSMQSGDQASIEHSKSPPIQDSIYAPNIRLSYTPPAALSLPSAFPKRLQVEGLPLYHASAAFIRHTLSAFNTDLDVNLCKLTLRSMAPRDRQIIIRTIVTGKSRLSGTQNEWDVLSTYTLSRDTALIEQHVVESIHPAPHITFYDGLRATLTRLAGSNMDQQPVGGMQMRVRSEVGALGLFSTNDRIVDKDERGRES